MKYKRDIAGHIPVLLDEVIDYLQPSAGERVLDVTLGLGGHALQFAEKIGPEGRLTAIDADRENMSFAKQRLSDAPARIDYIHTNFGSLPDCLPQQRREFDIVFADLGLSSPHVDDPRRGFTFRQESPLDMRYDRTSGLTAAQILSQWDPERLLNIFRSYGEIPKSHRLVGAIVMHRSLEPIDTSGRLSSLVNAVYGYTAPSFLPQVFQALRIAVNNEMIALETLLDVAPDLLAPGGRLGIISYHSLEDGMVKRAFKQLSTAAKDSITGAPASIPAFDMLIKKGISPQEAEVRNNPRSRSARFRALRRAPV